VLESEYGGNVLKYENAKMRPVENDGGGELTMMYL
jgi:hypothetical protein